MKKITIYLTLFCMIISTLCSCSGNSKLEANALENKTSESESGISDEQYAKQLAKENYTKIPDDAAKALDKVLSFAKIAFADENAEKIMCGYKSEQTIDNKKCYVFAVYGQKEEGLNKLGILAVSKNGKSVFLYDQNANKFIKV